MDKAGGYQTLDRPFRTLTTLDRFGLVQWEGRTPTLRMLQVPELKRAMGLPADFLLEVGTRRDRIRLLGNGVCPPVMQAVVGSLIGTARTRATDAAAPSAATSEVGGAPARRRDGHAARYGLDWCMRNQRTRNPKVNAAQPVKPRRRRA